MQLSSAQWGIIRQICAEQARSYLEKNYKPNVQMALDLGLDQSQIEEMARITEATAHKHKKQMDGSACPTVYVPLTESQTGRYFSEIVREQRAKIDVLQVRVADLKAVNSRRQSEHQIAVNLNDKLQGNLDRQMKANEELRARVEEQTERLRHSDSLAIQLSDNVANLQNRLRLWDDVGEASFRNHAACPREYAEKVNFGGQPKELLTNTDFDPDVVVQALVEKQFGPLKDGDKIVTNKETFTWFMGQWRRKSELEGFASAKKYT